MPTYHLGVFSLISTIFTEGAYLTF